ncbi:hypothetical protein N0V85_009742 [Neurospora sp. IMI 360204]|nr:hypothetical protein N0V85_009742 [Neurospora sp. IMI 360204]
MPRLVLKLSVDLSGPRWSISDYVFGTIKEPDAADEAAHKVWFTQRANAIKILLATLKNQAVITILTINGWDRKNKDPKVLEVLTEFLAIKRGNFDTMASFLNHYTFLRKRVQDAKFAMTDDFEVTLLFNTVKHQYPVDAKHWAAALEEKDKDKTLTTGGLLAKLSVTRTSPTVQGQGRKAQQSLNAWHQPRDARRPPAATLTSAGPSATGTAYPNPSRYHRANEPNHGSAEDADETP